MTLRSKDLPWRPRIVVGALVFLCLGSCSGPEPDSISVKAWYRPVPLGFCPRFLIEDRHAWVVGKLAPGKERSGVAQQQFTFRGYFVLGPDGAEKVRTSCDDRPYPIFHLLEVTGERSMALGESEPKVLRGPGVVVVPPDPVEMPVKVSEEPEPAKAKAKVKRKKRRIRRKKRSRKGRTRKSAK